MTSGTVPKLNTSICFAIAAIVVLLWISDGKSTQDDTRNVNFALWMEMDPVQCAQYEWDSLEEIEMINKQYNQLGLNILDAKTKTYKEKFGNEVATCQGCGCPEGYTVYVKVLASDVVRALELGLKGSAINLE